MEMDDVRDKLEKELNTVEWPALKPHAERGALFLLSQKNDLVEVGARVAADDKAYIQALLEANQLQRVEPEQIKSLDQSPSTTFVFVIVQPYVFAQEVLKQ
tara:strand:- start:15746 stop:16048 length:303 start_codon:yes stop_codon:yes gene_type:complete